MENLDNIIDDSFTNSDTNLDPTSLYNYRTAGTWAYFIGIIGFVMWVLLLISFIYQISSGELSMAMAMMPGNFFGVMITVYLVIFIIGFFFNFFLVKFGMHARKVGMGGGAHSLSESIVNLKNLFLFWGIITIVSLVLLFILFLVGLSVR